MAFRLYDIDQNGCIEEQEMVEVMKVGHVRCIRTIKLCPQYNIHTPSYTHSTCMYVCTYVDTSNERQVKNVLRIMLGFANPYIERYYAIYQKLVAIATMKWAISCIS